MVEGKIILIVLNPKVYHILETMNYTMW